MINKQAIIMPLFNSTNNSTITLKVIKMRAKNIINQSDIPVILKCDAIMRIAGNEESILLSGSSWDNTLMLYRDNEQAHRVLFDVIKKDGKIDKQWAYKVKGTRSKRVYQYRQAINQAQNKGLVIELGLTTEVITKVNNGKLIIVGGKAVEPVESTSTNISTNDKAPDSNTDKAPDENVSDKAPDENVSDKAPDSNVRGNKSQSEMEMVQSVLKQAEKLLKSLPVDGAEYDELQAGLSALTTVYPAYIKVKAA